jgi:hypothetical protein
MVFLMAAWKVGKLEKRLAEKKVAYLVANWVEM